MVKSKKMSKGSLAVIILAVLLVLSMILGLTGAWFTDKANGKDETNNGTFGTVTITQSNAKGDWGSVWSKLSTGTVVGKILPGSELTVKGGTVTLGADCVKSYVLIGLSDITVEVGAGEGESFVKDEALTTEFATYFTKPKFVVKKGETEATSAGADYAGMYVAEKGDAFTVEGGAATINTTLPNKFQGKNIVVKYTVKIAAVQFDNIEVGNAYTLLTTNDVAAANA
jgi:hypothetical protein